MDQTTPVSFRDKVTILVERPAFTNFILGLILFNAVTLGLETDRTIMAAYGSILFTIDKIILGIFVVELILKFIAYRFAFFKSGWNVFDLVIVIICLLPAQGPLAILRAFRIFRVFRLFSIMPQMRIVISGLLRALPGMGSVIGVIAVIFYISSVLVTKIFGLSGDPEMEILFGSLNQSMFTLFQLMTLENWVDGIVKPAMDVYPMAWLFFIPFIIITSFAILNLFIGVIVEAMQNVHREANRAEEDKERDAMAELHADIRALRAEIANLKSQIKP
jgi:voltage-gated sodium channel